MHREFKVDRDRFLLLSLALAAQHCAPTSNAPAAAPPADPQEESRSAIEIPATVDSTEQPSAEPEEPVDDQMTVANGCDNEVGTVNCGFVDSRYAGPACEGFGGSCSGLTHAYKPRVAEAIANCYAAAGRRACDIRVRNSCIRESLSAACPDPTQEPVCQATMQRCADRGITPRYSQNECVAALSALQKKERDWAAGAMGPTSEGCKLAFAVY